MPKDLTDVSQWETVAVPVGTDPATAGSVETPLQTLTDRSKLLRDFLMSLRLLNWIPVDVASLTTDGGLGMMIYEPVAGVFVDVVVDASGNGEESLGSPNLAWVGGTPPALGAGAGPSIATNGDGEIVVATGLLAPGSVSMRYRDGIVGAYTVPAAWGASGPAGQFASVAFGSGLWVALDVNTGFVRVSSGPLNAWGVPTADPGFAASGHAVVRHTGYEGDGTPHFVALTATEMSRSTNGLTWAAAAAHGIGGVPVDVAYSAFGAKWIAVIRDSFDATFEGLATSDDDGVTWTAAAPFASALTGTLVAAEIECDGLGGWVIVLADGSNYETWVSWDDGVAWTRIRMPQFAGADGDAEVDGVRLAYGAGRFVLMTDDGAGTFKAFSSLRANE